MEEYIDKRRNSIKNSINSQSAKTTIEISDSIWKWYNKEGELIKQGLYSESQEYKGLISMYEDKSQNDKKRGGTQLFYIADDGKYIFRAILKLR